MKYICNFLFILLVLTFFTSNVLAIPINLSSPGFVADLGVSLDQNTGSATFTEDLDHLAWYLANDNYVVAADATTLSFDYNLAWGQDDFDDYFQFELNFVPVLQVMSPDSGHFEIDLSPYRGTPISLAWGLVWGGNDISAGSIVSLSNVDDGAPAPVPEPATMLLLGIGIAGLAGMRRFKRSS